MVLLTIKVDFKDQRQLDSVLRALSLETFRHGNNDVYAMEHLSPGLMLTPGKPVLVKVQKRPRRSALIQPAKKKLTTPVNAPRGTNQQRKADHNRQTYVNRTDRETTYADTKWLRDRNMCPTFRLDKRAVQKRIARSKKNIGDLKSEMNDLKSELEGARDQLSATEMQLTAMTTTCGRLNDEIAALILDLDAENADDEDDSAVSFKVGSRNEYDCDFEYA